jgi:hypothetical protein
LKLKPWEFYELTIAEFDAMHEEYIKTDEDDWFRLAWAVSHIMNAAGQYKPPMTADRLLGKKKISKTITKEQKQKEWEELSKIFS